MIFIAMTPYIGNAQVGLAYKFLFYCFIYTQKYLNSFSNPEMLYQCRESGWIAATTGATL